MPPSITSERAKPTFGGHETFVFRHGWLKKGVDAAAQDAAIFTCDEALVTLGVGKNMVRSIRHWCLATELLTQTPTASRTVEIVPTELAQALLDDRGWDPYCEDPGTLWLLHWQLVTNQVRSLIWHLTFSTYYEHEFTKRQLAAFIERQLERLGITTTKATVDREVDVCLRTYVPSTRSAKVGAIAEETLDCPLADLDLLRYSAEDAFYQFNIGPKPTLPTAVFGYALLTFWPAIAPARQTATVEDCIYAPGSPGQAFKLDENTVVEHLETLGCVDISA